MSIRNPDTRAPGVKLLVAVILAVMLTVPLFAVYLLSWDRQTQAQTARGSIVAGWGGPQRLAGPVLVIPYQAQATETVTENGKAVARSITVQRELTLAPDRANLAATIAPERRKKSIYEAVIYTARATGTASFSLPVDLARSGVAAAQLDLARAELRFGLSDPRGLVGTPPSVTVAGRPATLRPGRGPAETGGSGFVAPVDASTLAGAPLPVSFSFGFRGNAWLGLVPQAGDTRWRVTSPWESPGFSGGFLPTQRSVSAKGFDARWQVGNLALGRSLVDTADAGRTDAPARSAGEAAGIAGDYEARVDLVAPVDLYSQVDRSVKYGFLFIGFTFAAFLLFDVIGGVRVAVPEYLLVGVALILFFVLLLAFAEVVGFAFAYVIAAGAIIGLLTAYSAAVLGSWRRGGLIAGLLAALYAVLYVLLSLEAFSLLIGSVLLFVALAGVMYVTRRLDWSGVRAA
ncbi:cell envelope integrity protein CreD [Sphingomonas sp.]|jgi:inner membrane protein|uniref:cell envelope integrity protein CreD n=1 Tax=Sphingomonas sp. TaxID=28214 RepID=UPI002D80BBC1|nr:cell envelope integrity protein CreD [Sphingomonas sp.]HEU0045853.1 cell envelope integrity protein CreD [Sphingomonas sp.]